MAEDYPQNDGKAEALALIKRGVACLEGNHELRPCQFHHWGILACIHCGYIASEGTCECGHPDADECFLWRYNDDGKPTGKGHLGAINDKPRTL